jgi:hypothetical protein
MRRILHRHREGKDLYRLPVPATGIAEVDPSILVATDEPTIRHLRPIPHAHDARIPGAHVKFAVGI